MTSFLERALQFTKILYTFFNENSFGRVLIKRSCLLAIKAFLILSFTLLAQQASAQVIAIGDSVTVNSNTYELQVISGAPYQEYKNDVFQQEINAGANTTNTLTGRTVGTYRYEFTDYYTVPCDPNSTPPGTPCPIIVPYPVGTTYVNVIDPVTIPDYIGEFASNQYDVYYGDADLDGYNDFYFHPKDRFVLIHGDIAIPLVLPKAEGFIASGVDSAPIFIEPLSLTEAEITARGLILAVENTDYFIGDFNGDGIKDIIVRGASNDSIAVQISGSNTTDFPVIATTYSSSPAGLNVSDRNNVFKVEDINNDGIDDLVAYVGSFPSHAYLSGGSQLALYTGESFKLAVAKTVVGATDGGHSVNADGSVSYSIPIAAPEGVGGMQPNVSLAYNSNSGIGHVGLGWSVAGLSAISRCPTDLDFGGSIDGVDFDSKDRFCLDGMPLVAVSGTYGANGTEYRTRSETFTKIISYGSVGNCQRNGVNVPGPQKFKVWNASGQIIEYGYTENSRVQAVDCNDVITWAINKQQDRFGNAVTYTYTESSGEHYINRIDYNGGNSSIRFEYQNAPRIHRSFYAGTPLYMRKLLKSIKTYEGAEALREYFLAYDYVGLVQTPKISQLRECAKLECLPLTTFNWSPEPGAGLTFQSINTYNSWWGSPEYTFVGDVDGDGSADIVSASGGNIYTRMPRSNGTITTVSSSVASSWGSAAYTKTGDFNGDGLMDIASFNGGNAYMKLAKGGIGGLGHFSSETWLVSDYWGSASYTHTGDFNGDGRTDIASIGSNNHTFMKLSTGDGFTSVSWYHGTNQLGSSQNTFTGDFNGDGLTDIASASGGNVYMKLSAGAYFISETWSVDDTWGSVNRTGDFNGDGLTDIVSIDGTQAYVKLSTGNGFVSHSWGGASMGDVDKTWVGDFNGDGFSDIASAQGSEVHVRRSMGNGFSSTTWEVPNLWNAAGYNWVEDFDGDGAIDMISLSLAKDRVFLKKSQPVLNRLDKVTNGLGLETLFTYKPLTDSSVYVKPLTFNSSNYPVVGTTFPALVVSNVQTSDGLGGYNGTSYRYSYLQTHVAGIGSLGFKEITETNDDSGIATTTTFSQDYTQRQQGAPLEIVTATSGGTELLHTTSSYDLVTWGTGDTYRFQVRSDTTTSVERDLNNTFLKKETIEFNTYDSFGNATLTTANVYDAVDVLQQRTTNNWGQSKIKFE